MTSGKKLNPEDQRSVTRSENVYTVGPTFIVTINFAKIGQFL